MRPDPRPILAALAVVFTASCASEPAPTAPAAPGTLAYDRGVFVELLEEHDKVRRTGRRSTGASRPAPSPTTPGSPPSSRTTSWR